MQPLDPELRRLIRDSLPQALPTAEMEERVLRGLIQRISGGGGGGEPVPGGQAASPASGVGLKTFLAGGFIAAAAVVIANDGSHARVPETAPPAVVAPPDVPGEPPAVVPEISAGPSHSSAATTERAGIEDRRAAVLPVTSPRPPRRAVPRAAPPPQAPAIDPLIDETRRVGLAEAALTRGDHRQARALAEELAYLYPRGQLALERQAIEICSRCGLAEPGAGAAAEAFLRAHAGTAVAARVQVRCGDAIRSSAK